MIPHPTHYVSAADEDTDVFLGACFVIAHSHEVACFMAEGLLGPPDDQRVQFLSMTMPPDKIPPDRYWFRMLSRAEILEFWPDAKSIREMEAEDHDDGTVLARRSCWS